MAYYLDTSAFLKLVTTEAEMPAMSSLVPLADRSAEKTWDEYRSALNVVARKRQARRHEPASYLY